MAEGRPKWGPSQFDEGKRDLTITEKIFGDIENSSPTVKALHSFMYTVAVAPVVWFRENVVEKVRGPEYNWYHRRYRRVPTIDECYFHDWGCRYKMNFSKSQILSNNSLIFRFEAQVQMERDKQVEEQIVQLLKYRAIDCANRERYMAVDQLDPNTRCGELWVRFMIFILRLNY